MKNDDSIGLMFAVVLPLALVLFLIGLSSSDDKPRVTDAQRLEQCQGELATTQRLLKMHVDAQR